MCVHNPIAVGWRRQIFEGNLLASSVEPVSFKFSEGACLQEIRLAVKTPDVFWDGRVFTVCVSLCVCTHMCMPMCVCPCVCVCVPMCVCVCLCTHVCVTMCVPVFMCVHVTEDGTQGLVHAEQALI